MQNTPHGQDPKIQPCGVFVLWAKGDLNPHVPKDTGT